MTSYYTVHISAEETQAAAEDEMMADGNGRNGNGVRTVRMMVMRTARAMVMRTAMMKVTRAVRMKAVRMRMMKETLNLLYFPMSIW